MRPPPPEETSADPPPRAGVGLGRVLGVGARGVAGVALVLGALLLGALAFLFNPPSELLRRAAAPVVRELINHQGFHVGGVTLLPGSRIALKDLLLGPPDGYGRPLLRLGSLVVRYDLSTLLDGVVTVRQIELDRPVVHLEMRGGKANWQTFLDGLTSGETKPEPEADEPGGLPDIRVRLDRLAINGLAAALDDGDSRVVLNSLNLTLDGFYSPRKSDLSLRVVIKPHEGGGSSLTLRHGAGDKRIEADLDQRLDLQVRLKDLHKPSVELKLDLDLTSQGLRAPMELSPVKLALRLDARASLAEDRLLVRKLGLTLGDEEILSLEGKVDKLTGARDLDLLLRRLRLPLDRLAPYAAAFFPGMELGGLLEVRDLRLRSSQAELQALTAPATSPAPPALPRLDGLVRASQVKVRLPAHGPAGMPLQLTGLDLELALAAGGAAMLTEQQVLEGLPPAATSPAPGSLARRQTPVALLGRLHLNAFKGAGATIRGLDLSVSAGAGLGAGLEPGPAAIKAALKIPSLIYSSAATGRLSLELQAAAEGSAHLGKRRARLVRLDLKVPRLIQARLKASLEEWGQRALEADLHISPLDLAKVVAWLPPRLGAPLGQAKPAGTLELKASVKGRLPGAGPLRPLDLPLDLDLSLGLKGLGLNDPGRKLKFAGLGGKLSLKTRRDLLRLDGQLAMASLAKPDLSLALTGLTFSPTVNITRRQLKADLVLGLERVNKADMGLTSQGITLKQRVTSALRMDRLLGGRSATLGPTRTETRWTVDRLRMALPANTITLEKKDTTLALTLDPRKGGSSTLSLKSDLARVRHEEQGLLVTGLKFRLDDEVRGHGGIQLPKPRIQLHKVDSTHKGALHLASLKHARSGADLGELALKMSGQATGFTLGKAGVTLERLTHKVGLTLERLSLRGVVNRPLRSNRLELELAMDQLKDLRLDKLSLRLPSRGVYMDLTGRVDDLFPLNATRLPRFDLKAEAGINNAKATEEAASTFLAPGVRGAGKLGMALRLGSSGGDRLQLKGRLLADAFHLWQRGGSAGRASRVEVRDLNARIPLAQQLLLRDGRIQLPAPREPLTSLTGRGALYTELRPFTRKTTGLTLGGLLLEKEGIKGTQKLRVDRAELDLALEDNALRMRRLYLKLFGGDIAGSLQAQVISLAPLDLVLQLRTQVTGVNLAYLDREAKVYTDETEVSAMMDLDYRPAREELAGRVEITSLSLKMLDAMLAYLDPDRVNPSVQENRKLLAAWYMKWIDPRVRQVSLWIRHGNANMDISMDAWFVVGTILRRVLENMHVRRLNILPMLRREVTPMMRKLERSLGGVRAKPVAIKKGAAAKAARAKPERAKQ